MKTLLTVNKKSKSYDHGLDEKELAALYAEQAEIEANTYLRMKNPVPKEVFYPPSHFRSVFLTDNGYPREGSVLASKYF